MTGRLSVSRPCFLTTPADKQARLEWTAALVIWKIFQWKLLDSLVWSCSPHAEESPSVGWSRFSCHCSPDHSELRASAVTGSLRPWLACWEQPRAEECCHPERDHQLWLILINYYSHCLWRPLELHTPAAGRWWRLKESCRWDSDPLRRCLWSRPGAEVWSLLVPWLQHSQTHTQPASHRTPATTHFTTKSSQVFISEILGKWHFTVTGLNKDISDES